MKTLYYIAGMAFFVTIIVGQMGDPADADWQDGAMGWVMSGIGYIGLCGFVVALGCHWIVKATGGEP